MRKNPASQSGIFTPRVLVAFALCSVGALLGMFSLAATPLSELASGAEPTARSEGSPSRKPVETTRANTSVPPDRANFLSTFDSNANRLPPGLPLPPSGLDAPLSELESSPSRKPGRKPLRTGTASRANLLGNPLFANQQPAPRNMQQPAASESRPLASGAAGDWSIVDSPNGIASIAPGTTYLLSDVCVSASACWAVGYYVNGSVSQTLIERWDGTSWAIVSSPNTRTTRANVLYGVTCMSASNCWAVGYYDTGSVQQTLIEHWDGTSWAIVISPTPTGTKYTQLSGATCASASNCWAVGYYFTGSVQQTLIERWDGTSWAIVASPNTSATQYNFLVGVTCVPASDCWAVGYASNGSVDQTLIERWDGTSWTIVTSPNTSAAQPNDLAAVTCVSASNCWAVGSYFNGTTYQTLIGRWDGTSWTIVTSPNTSATQNILYGVTCVSTSNCWAAGDYLNGSAVQTLIERWDGTSWTIVTSPNALTAQNNVLYGVTCESASNCWAVGYYVNGNVQQTLIEQWNGIAWAIVTSPNAKATLDNVLAAVTCVSASECWAVGDYSITGSVSQTLIERWDGTSWTIVGSPNTSALLNNVLLGVTCMSASDCWAVGYYNPNPSSSQTLIERWNGTSWNIVTSPNPTATSNTLLFGVTCVSASDCWAVGASASGIALTLVERWDGTSWAIVTSPNVSHNNVLSGVTCVSASDCWAVGNYYTGIDYQTLIERWDGTLWTIVVSANTSATQDNHLAAVTCVSASDCWAVGYYVNGSADQTLIERWDGTLWTIVSSPNTSATQSNFLSGVTCVSASNCWAVGFYVARSASQTLIERWDGTSWAIVASPNTSATQDNSLNGVTCTSASNCWAVGSYVNGSAPQQTLIEEFTIPVQLVSVASRMTHGSAGPFDINLPLTGTRGVECRSASLGAGNYTVVFTFVNNVTSCGTAGTAGGSVTSGPNPNQCTENLTGVPNAQYTTITLNNVLDSLGNTGNVSGTMGVLLGDVNATGLVDGNDVSAVQGQARQTANSTNFRLDVNTTGLIDGNDVSLVQSKTRTSLPSPP